MRNVLNYNEIIAIEISQRISTMFIEEVVLEMVVVEGFAYEVLEDVREGFIEEDFIGRYSDILAKYDYIVGDWGYGQLRLKGFFDDKNQKSTFDTKFSTFEDYLYEYCNFGCAYFILKKTGKAEPVVEVTTDEVEQVEIQQELVEEPQA